MPLPKGFHWSSHARKQRVQNRRQNQPFRGAFFSQVTAPAENERVAIEGSFHSEKVTSFAYPFASSRSWIRGQPEVGTVMLSVIGSDSNDVQPVAYYDSTKVKAAIDYADKANQIRSSASGSAPGFGGLVDFLPYRTLNPGDLDLASNFAQLFLGLKDVFQARGGLSHLTMTSKGTDVDTNLFRIAGSEYIKRVPLRDELRFGVVRRATSKSSPSSPALIKSSSAFAKEFTVHLNDGSGINGGNLIDHRQGLVVNDDGSIAKATNGKELRARYKWYSATSATTAEIDRTGNFFFATSTGAGDVSSVRIPSGGFLLDVNKTIDLKANSDVGISSSVGFMRLRSSSGFHFSTNANGEVVAKAGLDLRSEGLVRIESSTFRGVQVGTNFVGFSVPLPKWPVLVANPAYVSSLRGYYTATSGLMTSLSTYGASAAAAWSAVGALMMLLDPSAATSSLCLSAAAAATAVTATAPTVSATLSLHQGTLGDNPSGFQSTMMVSE